MVKTQSAARSTNTGRSHDGEWVEEGLPEAWRGRGRGKLRSW